MASAQQVDILTQALQAQFINGYEAVTEIPDIEQALLRVPSKGRTENFGWLFPAPNFSEFKGYRNYAKQAERKYRVDNKTWSAAMQIPVEDIDDDQTGGWAVKAAEMGENAKNWPAIEVQLNLALGQTTPCFDDSNFFATTHNEGTYPTGGNIVSATTADSSGTHNMVVLVTSGKVKPLLWQTREEATFRTDKGDNESDKTRVVKSWGTMRGAPAFGFPWDAILCKFTGLPTVPEVQTALGQINARFRQFVLPKNLSSDANQYPHAQRAFTDKNVLALCSSGIEHIVRQALTLSLVSSTENFFRGWAKLVCCGFIDNVT